MDVLCKRVMVKLLRRKYQGLFYKIYPSVNCKVLQFNSCRNVNSMYKMSSSISNPIHKDLYLNIESISFRHMVNNYMCKLSISNKNCWKCGENLKIGQIFCDKCTSLQQVDEHSNYFEIIGVDQTYDLNVSELSQKYRKLQFVLHPDKFGNKTKEEKLISEEYSSIVNKAYFTLLHPLERGLYMLKLNGLQIDEGAVQMDKTFLMEIMEINEEIENETDPKILNRLNETNKMCLNSLTREVAGAFERDDTTAAKEILTKMKYYTSIEDNIKELKQKRGIPD